VYLVLMCRRSLRKGRKQVPDFNFKIGLFVASLPIVLGLLATSLAREAHNHRDQHIAHSCCNEPSNSFMQAQLPPSVRISKYSKWSVSSAMEALLERRTFVACLHRTE
jgi:hypothetical protein